MDQVISPIILYSALALGAIGVLLALPRKGVSPQVLGAMIAGAAGGLVLLGLALKAGPERLPNIYFYIFALIALGSSLRVITHPRPVYSALFFILTILSSAGLYLVLSAEFMAFALIIVYAGAILITYLFVIMLATQAPTEDQLESLAEYDREAREPLVATLAGFLILGALTTMLFRGAPGLSPVNQTYPSDAILADMPRKIERVLSREGLLQSGEQVASGSTRDAAGKIIPTIDADGSVNVVTGTGMTRSIPREQWEAAGLDVRNVEGLGFALLRDHPVTIEIAGVILLMAMLGAVVLARKQVDLDEEAKRRHAERLSLGDEDVSPAPGAGGGPGGAA